jgi:hypothetical protein
MSSNDGTARERLARPPALSFAVIRHIRRRSFIVGMHRHLRRVGLSDQSKRAGNWDTYGAWAESEDDFFGAGIGIVAAVAAAHVLERLVEGMQPAQVSTFAVMIPILVLAALFASFVPARRASRVDPVKALRQD